MATVLPATSGRRHRRIDRLWAAVTAAAGSLALAMLLVVFVQGSVARGHGALAGVVVFFSYFTTLSNLLVAASLTFRLLAPRSRPGIFFARSSITAATAVYITTVAVVYSVALRHLWHPVGLMNVIDHLLHDVVPLLYVGHWIIMAPKGRLPWTSALAWLGFPLAYLLCVLARGAGGGVYPYPFLDVGKLGSARVFTNVVAMTMVFLFVGLVIVAVDRRLARPAMATVRDEALNR
jgi:hypothetical protein